MGNPLKAILFALPLALFMVSVSAQDPIRLTTGSDGRSTALHEWPWRFHPGDSLLWARPDYDARGWDTVNVAFGDHNPPPGWTGFGWFRAWVKKDRLDATAVWGLNINHDAASEWYVDGKQVAALGKLGHSADAMAAVRLPYSVYPVAITDTLPHLIAVRYSNYHGYFPDFLGFQAWMGDMHTLNTQAVSNLRAYDSLRYSVAIQGFLLVFHLFLFLFYPRYSANLYYCFFVLATIATMYARYLTVVTEDPAMQVLAYQVFASGTMLVPVSGALLLYRISRDKLPRARLWILASVAFSYIAYLLVFWDYNLLMTSNLFSRIPLIVTFVAFGDGLWSVFKAIRKGNRRLWLIAIGMLVIGVLSIVVGGNLFGWMTSLQTVLGVMALATLIIPVIFSIYLAMDVAAANRSLARQLEANERLAAQNLAQEQEKSKLLAEEAERLEKTVLERTAQVRQQAERLREMDEAKSRFFVNLTHEFKTPLTLIINPAKELLQQADTEAGKQYARYILHNSERLLQLINQLLDLSRLESGEMAIQLEPVDLVNWLKAHVQLYSSLADQKRIDLSFHTDADALWMLADVDKLEKIVQNLLSNAIKFNREGGTVHVDLLRTTDQQVEITVADSGVGIPPEKLPRVFDRFFQVDTSDTRAREGAGIGLALAKELAQLLGGGISVWSEEGEGTRFCVMLPYQAADVVAADGQTLRDSRAAFHPASPASAMAAPDTDAATADSNTQTVLVVEDHRDLRQFIYTSLAPYYRVLTAQDGQDGIAVACEHIPDLIITDLMMPNKNGYQLCETLKTDERTSHIPVIMLTAKTDQESRIQGIETGADAYLAKPFDQRELLALMENLIRTREQLRSKFGKDNVWLSDTATLPSIEKTFLDKVRRAVETNLDNEQYGAQQLAADVALSRTQLHRKLKAILNQSPGDLVRTIRMQRALELLQRQVASVSEIGYMVGYGNPANFSTAFARHFGFPPSSVGKTDA